MTMKQAMEILAVQELRPVFMGTGIVVGQVPAPNAPMNRGDFIKVHFQPFVRAPEEEPEEEVLEILEENNDDPS
jgi:hypothetical protein